MRVLLACLTFIILVGGLAYLIAKLSDFIERRRELGRINMDESLDIQAVAEWARKPLPSGLQEIHTTLEGRIESGRTLLPLPNQDIELRGAIPLNPRAYRALGWDRRTYVPIAEINDGDLLVVSLDRPFGAVMAYFHDGEHFDVIYPSVAEMARELS
jgi:hypothetical protein